MTSNLSVRNLEDGGQEIRLRYTPEEVKALGHELPELLDRMDSALMGLAMMRTGQALRPEDGPRPAFADDWYWVLTDVAFTLLPRLEGIRDGAIREHRAAGGSLGQLAAAMDVAKSTAQYRRDALPEFPNTWEEWARNGGPQDRPKRPTPQAR
jgi:hypothetical protein